MIFRRKRQNCANQEDRKFFQIRYVIQRKLQAVCTANYLMKNSTGCKRLNTKGLASWV
uniref:Uncharacterized protein n=1 Tax=Arion vulgaris TaxID=1028688 RepID=A0A0B7AF10_9EUPU